MPRAIAPRLTSSAIINVMLQAAQKAASGLLRDFGELAHLQVSQKGPGNFVSAADKRSEKILIEALRKAHPTYSFLTEETGVIEGEDTTHRWIIDPLDGTTNFLHGNPHFCISIALEVHGEVTAGLIHDPLRDEFFWAEKGVGAYLNNTRLRTSGRAKLSECILGVGIPSVAYGNTPLFLRQMQHLAPRVAGVRCSGSGALDIAYVAAGRLDAYWEGDISPWDMAAGVIIAREAGVTVTDVTGGPDPLGANSILTANPKLHATLAPFIEASMGAAKG